MRVTDTTYSGGMRVTNYSNEKLLMFDNTFQEATYTNSDAYDETLAIGTVMGRVASTGKVVVFDKDNSDGSQFPIGVLVADYTVGAGDDATLTMVIGGEINGNMLVFPNGETVETVVSSRQVKDWLQLANINLSYPAELSALDNQ